MPSPRTTLFDITEQLTNNAVYESEIKNVEQYSYMTIIMSGKGTLEIVHIDTNLEVRDTVECTGEHAYASYLYATKLRLRFTAKADTTLRVKVYVW